MSWAQNKFGLMTVGNPTSQQHLILSWSVLQAEQKTYLGQPPKGFTTPDLAILPSNTQTAERKKLFRSTFLRIQILDFALSVWSTLPAEQREVFLIDLREDSNLRSSSYTDTSC